MAKHPVGVVMSCDHISLTRLVDPPDQGQGQLALGLGMGSCMREKILVSRSFSWVARKDVSYMGLKWDEMSPRASCDGDRQQMQGRGVRSLRCAQGLFFSFVQGLVEEGHVHTFAVGWGSSQAEEHPCQPTLMLVLATHHYDSRPHSIPCQPWTLSGTEGPLVSLGPAP